MSDKFTGTGTIAVEIDYEDGAPTTARVKGQASAEGQLMAAAALIGGAHRDTGLSLALLIQVVAQKLEVGEVGDGE